MAIVDFIANIPVVWKVVGALGMAASVGFSIALTSVGFVGLPSQVEANTRAIERNEADIRTLLQADSTIICLLTLPDSVPPIQARRACP